jgi:hypothetical protein
VQSDKSQPMFQGHISPTSLGLKNKPSMKQIPASCLVSCSAYSLTVKMGKMGAACSSEMSIDFQLYPR